MASLWTWVVVTTLLCLARGALRANASTCSTTVSNKVYNECTDLTLGALYAWSYDNATNSVDFAFTEDMQSSSGWVAWGINPTGPYMQGTQALIAFQNSSGITVKEYNVTLAVKLLQNALVTGPVSVNYSRYSASMSGTVVTIVGTFTLPAGQSATLSSAWNRGPSVDTSNSNYAVTAHSSSSVSGIGTLNYSTATSSAGGSSSSIQLVGDPHQKLKNVHGVINAVSWGILIPIGVMAARYLRPFAWADPLWFYLHVTCEIIGYLLGVVGWGIGCKLQQYATPIKYKHRNLGISIFTFATLQVLAIVLRPKRDSKVRKYWNVYHHTIGYTTIILIIINIFEGFHWLNGVADKNKWKAAYKGVLITLGVISLILEIITWIAWFQRRPLAVKKHNPHNDEVKDYEVRNDAYTQNV